MNDVLSLPIERLKLNRRIINALKRGNIRTVADLIKWNGTDLKRLKYMGIKSLMDVDRILSELGLTLSD